MPIELTIEGGRELYDEYEQRFYTLKNTVTLKLEHSLLSLAKWESKWKTPFLIADPRGHSEEKTRDYIRCMTLTQSVDPMVYLGINDAIFAKIREYMNDKMTATWFSKDQMQKIKGRSGPAEVITSELIYYWMVSYNIPFSCEKWHLNRLLTLIQICGIKQQQPEKIPRTKLNQRNTALNHARRAKMHSRG